MSHTHISVTWSVLSVTGLLLNKNLTLLPPVIPQGKFCLIENYYMQLKFSAFFCWMQFFFHVSR